MEPLFPNCIYAFMVPELEEEIRDFKIKWVLPEDKSKLFWEITDENDPEYKVYASKLEFRLRSTADYNRIYTRGAILITTDNVAIFYEPSKEEDE